MTGLLTLLAFLSTAWLLARGVEFVLAGAPADDPTAEETTAEETTRSQTTRSA